MQLLAVLLASASAVVAAPFSFPLANGFPNLNNTALQEVSKLAGGTLPNGPLPSTLKAAGIQALQLIATNELFEVAYFTSLLQNVTEKVDGYNVDDYDYVVETLTAIVNQEELHALAANAVLSNANATAIEPCQYTFPVTTFKDAILTAQTFTEVVLGYLPIAQFIFAADGGAEIPLVKIIGSVIGQEGEQAGYYRFLQKKVPSSAPFLTGPGPKITFNAVSQFIVEGSCPNIEVTGYTQGKKLTLETTVTAMNSTQLFSIPSASNVTETTASMTYLNGQNTPVTVNIKDVNNSGDKTYFFADLPYDLGFARGLTVAVLTNGTGKTYANTSETAANALNGPALIEID